MLVDIPKLTKCVLVTAFKCVEAITMKNASMLESMSVLKDALAAKKEMDEEAKAMGQAEKNRVAVKSIAQLTSIETLVAFIDVGNYCCKEDVRGTVDWTHFVYLKELKVGNYCFKNVEIVKFVGMKHLEKVMIGKNSFTRMGCCSNALPDPNRHFYLKDCPRMKELKVGDSSFSDFTVCEVENTPALEVFDIGCWCFPAVSSLQLNSERVSWG